MIHKDRESLFAHLLLIHGPYPPMWEETSEGLPGYTGRKRYVYTGRKRYAYRDQVLDTLRQLEGMYPKAVEDVYGGFVTWQEKYLHACKKENDNDRVPCKNQS